MHHQDYAGNKPHHLQLSSSSRYNLFKGIFTILNGFQPSNIGKATGPHAFIACDSANTKHNQRCIQGFTVYLHSEKKMD
jgi:hypothetical protein